MTSLVYVQTAAAVAADELILCDPAHLRPWILMRLHYNGITLLLIKMGKVTQRAFTFGSVDTCGDSGTDQLLHTHAHFCSEQKGIH